MKRLAAFTVLCGFGSVASAWSIFAGGAAMSSVASLATEAAATTSSEDIAPSQLCVSNFSKNGCDGYVEPGHVEDASCSDFDCRTIRVTEAVYRTTLKSSGLTCGINCEQRCDEFPDAELTLKFDYILRADSCCPYRGSWDGEWELVTENGRTFTGTAHGTLGVGTNRASDCNQTDDACERCYDVQLQDSRWLVGMEGSFRGTSVFSTTPTPDELNFTIDGTWNGSAVSQYRPFTEEAFRVYNRFDGAYLDYCN